MKLKITLVCLILLTFSVACQRNNLDEPMNPDMAKSMIRLKGYTADEAGLFQAVKNNDVVILKAFFDAGVNPNGFNETGETPLTLAVQYAETKTVKALLDKVNINQQDKNGKSKNLNILRALCAFVVKNYPKLVPKSHCPPSTTSVTPLM